MLLVRDSHINIESKKRMFEIAHIVEALPWQRQPPRGRGVHYDPPFGLLEVRKRVMRRINRSPEVHILHTII